VDLPQAIVLKISDPWDLGESLGWQPLPGSIISVNEEKNPSAVLVKLDAPFQFRTYDCQFFIASPRHLGDQLDQVARGMPLFCGLTRISTEEARSANPFDLSRWRGGVAIIGELQAQ
jgi:hypothetical protein